ncbi:MAG: DUF481 domain-containing protein [Myxococcota bacterium]|nr:DUF481 domain-containing protein [Myxococcota bacterium]
MQNHVLVAAIVLAAPSALAQPKFEYGKSEEVEKVKDVEWTAQADAGLVFTTGNAETTTISAGVKASRKTGFNKFSIDGSMTYAKSGARVLQDNNGNGMIDDESEITTVDTITAESYAAKLRYDRFLTKHNSLFVAALASRDRPAGKEKVLGFQVGYSRQIYKTEKTEAVAEIGYDFSREDLTGGTSLSIHSARAFLGVKSEMTEGTALDASLEALTNLNEEDLPTGKDGGFGKDTRLNGKIAISSKIGKNLSVQTSIELKYDHRPGPLPIKGLAMGFVPEASKLDTIMKASLIYQIF